jgi:DNA-binding HxlR family transcriptional regulator
LGNQGTTMKSEDQLIEDCSQTVLAIYDTMEILGGKWKVLIIACLCYHPMRYSELLKKVRGISGKMLSRELKELEVNGLIERNVLATSPVTVAYEITEYGKSLKQLTQTIAEWGFQHRARILKGMRQEKV